jgi:Mrp family chromosome partitioning ATPase
MSRLDQAFIKAYSESAPCGSRPEQRVGEGAETTRAISTPDAAASGAAPRLSARLPKSQPAETEQPTSIVEAVEKPASLATAPLSAFAPPPEDGEPVPAAPAVDRQAWPETCDHLLAQASHAWDSFADQLIEQLRLGHKCMALVSCQRGEGRTTISLAVAKYLAAQGLRPVVVDADCENPSLARRCGISVRAGWDDFLAGEPSLDPALVSAVAPGVTLMPWRGAAIPIGKLASSLRTATGFGILREQFDLVLLDTMPLVGQTTISDFAGFAEAIHLDAVFLVRDVRATTTENAARASARLRRAGVLVAGVIENFVSTTSHDASSVLETSESTAGRELATYG